MKYRKLVFVVKRGLLGFAYCKAYQRTCRIPSASLC